MILSNVAAVNLLRRLLGRNQGRSPPGTAQGQELIAMRRPVPQKILVAGWS
jgi:hypothetical protein